MAKGTAQEWTVLGLSVELGIDRVVLGKKLKGLKPAREDGKSRFFYMADVFRHLAHGENLDPQQEAAKLNKARREKLEIEKAELIGLVVNINEVADMWTEQITHMKARLLSIPSKATTQILAADTYGEAEKILKAQIREALGELAEWTLQDTGRSDSESADASP
jgi:hypothetical protein